MNNTKTSFTNTVFRNGIFCNIPSAIIIFILSAFFVSMSYTQIPWAIMASFCLILVSEFLIAPFTNRLITSRLSDKMDKWKDNKMVSIKERTLLLREVNRYPLKKGIETFIIFAVGSALLCTMYCLLPGLKVDYASSLISFASCIFGSYNAGIFAYSYAEKQCNINAMEIFKDGVDKDFINRQKYFGLSTKSRCIFFLIIPAVYANFLIFITYTQSYMNVNGKTLSPVAQMIRMGILTVLIFAICFAMALLYFTQIKESNRQMAVIIEKVVNEGSRDSLSECSLCDEIQYNIFLLNNTVMRYKDLITRSTEIGNQLLKSTTDLSVLSEEFEATSIAQNKTVQEVKEKAQEQTSISQNIQQRMNVVSREIEQTTSDVEQSFNLLDESIAQFRKIDENNSINTQRIKDLSHQIDSIDDILIMIKEIADQTRIIAFNAELEAVSAKEEGRNFHIVATEIRRLASSTMNSIHEIQSNIESIQNASLSLIHSAENENNYIQEENSITTELKTHFTNIQSSSEETNQKSIEINDIIQQQTKAFDAITVTLAQISEGFSQFTVSTKNIRETANKMKGSASQLSGL